MWVVRACIEVELAAAILAGACLVGCAAHRRAPELAASPATAIEVPRGPRSAGPAAPEPRATGQARAVVVPAPVLPSADRAVQRAGTPEPGAEPEADTTGPRLPGESIRRVVRWNVGRFRDCYQRALVSNPKLGGYVSVRFWIDGAGAARDAQVEATDLPLPVAGCIADAFGQLQFPALEGGPIGVRYGFQLGSSDGAKAGAEPTSETLRANQHTPSAEGSSTGAAPDVARNRLFRLFLAGLEQGPSAPPLDVSSPNAGASTTPAGSEAAAQTATRAGGEQDAQPRCPTGDPLCSDI